MKVDPSGHLLNSFIDLNNLALSRFSAEERRRIGVHTCPGGDRDSTHSADVDYEELLPSLFELNAGNFYVALAGEKDRARVLRIIRRYMKPDQRVFVGVIATDRSAGRDARGGPGPHPGGRRIHPRRTARHDGRLRLLAVQRRHVDEPRHGVRKDPFPRARHRARRGRDRSAVKPDDEEVLLRSVAMQNAKSILLARQHAERELLGAKEELERKTRELAGSLAMMRATLESTSDGILVTDAHGHVTDFNRRYVDMWRIPHEIMETKEHRRILEHACRQFEDGRPFLARIDEIHSARRGEPGCAGAR